MINAGSAVSQGNIPDQWITDQMDVLNDAFLSVGYQFLLASVDRTNNPDWYFGLDLGTPEETQMKQTLAIDPAHFMNFYTARLAGGLLGWAYFPFSFSNEDNPLHGVVVLDQSLPGGNAAPYNLGDTGTHEVGHYVGLLHTFQGGCSGGDTPPGCESGGDGVCDTPSEASPAFGCPIRNTCSPVPDLGPDPIHNFMDYTDDSCMFEFTPGQAERAVALMAQYRPTIMEANGAFASPETLAFGDLDVGSTGTQTATVVNLTDSDLEITDISTDSDVFTTSVESLTVPANDAVEIEVSFTPDEDVIYEGTLFLETDNDDVGTLEVALEGGGRLAPALNIDNPAILAAAEVGEETTETITLTNTGEGTLIYSFSGFGRIGGQAAARSNAGMTVARAVKGSDVSGSGAPVRFGEGGPDAFGYIWIDSNEPDGPDANAYDDISGSGNAVSWTSTDGNTQFPAEDEGYADVDLPFSFPFYGQTYDGVRLFTNGFLTFDQSYADAAFNSYSNTTIPAPAEPNAALYPFWDDITFEDAAAGAYVLAEADRVVLQFEAGRFGAATPSYFFQVVLFPSGAIEYRYGSMSGILDSATIGIENEDGSVGLEVASNTAYLESGLTIRFEVDSSGSFISSISPASGSIEAGGQQEVEVTLSAAGLEAGVYQDLLSLLSNDPLLPDYRIHVVFAVGGVLPPPALVGPAYGERDVPVDLALTWRPVPTAESYDLEVATDEEFSNVVFSGSFDDTEGAFAADAGATFYWRVRSVAGSETSEWSLPFVFTTGTLTASEQDETRADGFGLGAAYPNPTSGTVTVPFTLKESQAVTLRVFDVTGRLVAVVAENALFGEGSHTVQWDGSALPSGVYLLRLTGGGQVDTERLVVLR